MQEEGRGSPDKLKAIRTDTQKGGATRHLRRWNGCKGKGKGHRARKGRARVCSPDDASSVRRAAGGGKRGWEAHHTLWFRSKALSERDSLRTWEGNGLEIGLGGVPGLLLHDRGVLSRRPLSGAKPARWRSRGASTRGLVVCLGTLNFRGPRLPGAKLNESAVWARALER
jgi:hypothetical protein